MKVPTDATGRMDLLAVRPVIWEYLLFGSVLHAGLERTETKWRDYSLGYTMNIGPVVTRQQLASVLSEQLSRAAFIVSNLHKIISKEAQESAFGLPGVTGDASLIEHMGNRLIDLYEQLLDWADGIRSLRVPGGVAEELREVAALFVSQPIAECRSFVEHFITSVEEVLVRLRDGEKGDIKIEMGLVFEIPKDVSNRYNTLLKKAVR